MAALGHTELNQRVIAMSESHVIVKFGNRRLYDRHDHGYINHAVVRKLVEQSVDFTVIDYASKRDVTWATLLRVIAALENEGKPLLCREFLAEIIRTHDSPARAEVSRYLDASLRWLHGDLTAAASSP